MKQLGAFRSGDYDAPNKLAIAICTLGYIRAEVVAMLINSGMPLGQARLLVLTMGYGIQEARNLSYFRAAVDAGGWEYFMFWDDDVVPLHGGEVETMLETMEQNPQIDILGGVYPARQNIPSPIVLKEKNGSPWWGWEDGGIHRVWMTGTGFTMYRTSSLNKLDAPLRKFSWQGQELEIPQIFRLDEGTDDYALAQDAEAAGLRWYVHGGVVCDQVESNGHRFEVKNARQRITEETSDGEEDRDLEGRDDHRRGGVGSQEERAPADVLAG